MEADLKRNMRFRLFSLLLFIVINVIVFNKETIWDYSKYKLGFETIHLEEMHQIISEVDSTGSSEVTFEIINENIIVVEDKKIKLFDKLGHIQWEKEVFSNNIQVLGNSQVILIVDKEKGDLFTIDYMGNIIGEKYGLGTVLDICVSEIGITVFVEEENKIANFDIQLNALGVLDLPFGSIVSITTGTYENVVSVSHMEIKDGIIDDKVFT